MPQSITFSLQVRWRGGSSSLNIALSLLRRHAGRLAGSVSVVSRRTCAAISFLAVLDLAVAGTASDFCYVPYIAAVLI